VKSGAKLVVVLAVIFIPVIAFTIISIGSQLPRTASVQSSLLQCVEGCPSPQIWVGNVTGWSKVTLDISPSPKEAVCLQTASGNLTIECSRYVVLSNDSVHWTIAKVIGPQTVCYGGGLNCVCCLHDYIEFPVYQPLTITFPVEGKYVGITGQNGTTVSIVGSR
jgi:hypothetical protein